MLEERYLDEAIAQNLGAPDPDAMTCIRLAAQLIDRILLYGMPGYLSKTGAADFGHVLGSAILPPGTAKGASASGYSMADATKAETEEIVYYQGKTDFAREIDGKRAADIWPVMDDVMSIFAAIRPDLYERAMQIIKTK